MKFFVDTSAWFALASCKDRDHAVAAEFIRQFSKLPVLFYTTDYIVDETVTLLRTKLSHAQAIYFLDETLASNVVVRVPVSRDLLTQAEEIFRKHKDKNWSYTDCVSFAFMDEQQLEDAFAFDNHFTQYGKRVHPQVMNLRRNSGPRRRKKHGP